MFRLKNIKMKPKMIGMFLIVGLLPLSMIGWQSTRAAKDALMAKSFDQLESLRQVKKGQVEFYFNTINNQMLTFSENQMIVDATREFARLFKSFREETSTEQADIDTMRRQLATYYTGQFGTEYKNQNDGASANSQALLAQLGDDAIAMQYNYIQANPNPLGSKHLLDKAEDGSKYSDLHGHVHPIIASFLDKFGYYDIFLVDAKSGNVVYSVYKELDYATSLINGPYAGTNFARAFRDAASASDKDFITLVDFEQYTPSYEAPASFIASPIFDGDEKVGVAVFQMPLDVINGIMQERAGLGESGETYLVGPDNLMRSDSFLDPVNHTVQASFRNPELGGVNTDASNAALNGEADRKVVIDYNGNPVLSAYTPIELVGLKWALLAEIDLAEVEQPINALAKTVVIIGLIIAVAVGVIAFLIAVAIASPLIKGVNFAEAVAAGDLTQQSDVDQNDEIGILAKALNAMASNLRGIMKDVTSNSDTLSASSEEMASTSDTMSRRADQMTNQSNTAAAAAEQASASIQNVATAIEQVSANSSTVASASEEVSSNLNTVGAAVEEMSSNMNSIASSVEEMSSSVNTVATAVEEMSTSLADVSANTKDAAKIAEEATQKANNTAKTVNNLGESAREIDKVVDIITGIAAQTNLLALNATIEAASAGEAGKGFAVVANEVKELAKQTAAATEDIRSQVESMQGNTDEAVGAIGEIVDVIGKVNTAFGTIASAVEQQTQTVNEIAKNVSDAASGAEEVSRNVQDAAVGASEVSRNVQEATSGVNDIAKNVAELANGATEIANSANEAAAGMNEVAQNVKSVNEAAQETKIGADGVKSAAQDLSGMAGQLQELVGQFTV